MKTLYYDCFAGISGDMHLGALLDAGVEEEYLRDELTRLNVKGWELTVRKESKKGIQGTRAEVTVKEHLSHRQHTRFREIREIIEGSTLTPGIKEMSLRIFSVIAEAEAKVHGKPVEDVVFHEVGAVDSIIDIVGAAVCIHRLGPDRIVVSPVQLGSGFVQCAHGTLPVPAPAVVEILRGVPVLTGAVPFEATTPTGAAIIRAAADEFTGSVAFTPEKTGYGIGFRDGDIPNVLRVIIGEDGVDTRAAQGDAVLLECNIDDMNPEMYEHIMDILFAAGAADVFLTPIIMKKSRPGILLKVLVSPGKAADMERIVFAETSTFGIRSYPVHKTALDRDVTSLDTPYGPVRIKHAYAEGRKIKSKPEYEDCRRIAAEQGISIQEVYRAVSRAEFSEGGIE